MNEAFKEVAMLSLPGFPITVGGNTKFEMKAQGWRGFKVDDDWSALAVLVQRAESAFIDAHRHGSNRPEELARTIRDVATSEAFSPFLEVIHSAHVDGDILEVELSAAGYPGRYVSHLCIHGSGSRYKLRRAPEPKRVVSSCGEGVASPEDSPEAVELEPVYAVPV